MQLLAVIWACTLADEVITCEELVWLVPMLKFHRSPVLNGLLSEIAVEVHAERGFWVTAFVVASGKSYPGDGFFQTVPEQQWKHAGRARFASRQRKKAHAWLFLQ